MTGELGHTEITTNYHWWLTRSRSDKYCRQILSAQLPAMKQGAILIINDVVLPDLTNISAYEEYGARVLDMTMLAYVNGKERNLEQWKAEQALHSTR